ncbi:MAG: transglycosylase SLT domain-containing protein [Anaerolineae bacterium]|nr:transglycosylase SLT domain-containing protein [Anaerolineae bacterium]
MPRLSLVTVPAAARSLTALAGRVLLTVLLLAGILVLAPEAEAEPASANLDAPLALMESGRYEEAAQSLIQLLPDMDPGAAREARTHLAECYELSGSWTDAARLWHDLAIGTLDRDQRSAALFREASARQEAGELEEAAELYVGFHYLRPGSAAQSEALSRAADGFAALDRWPVAASYYQLALEHSTNPGERLGLAYRLSEALLLSGQGNAALAALVAETGSVAADDLPRYQYQRARLELSLGQARAGRDRLLSVIQEYPRSSYAHPALVELVNAGEPVDEHRRGLVNYYAQAYQPAVAAFERYLAAAPSDRVASAHHFAGLSYRGLGDFDSALAHLDAAIALTDDPDSPAAWPAKAQTLDRMGDDQGAVEVHRAFAAAYPGHELAPASLLQAGILLEALGDLDGALQVYSGLLERHPTTDPGRAGAMRAGLTMARSGDWTSAGDWFQAAVDHCSSCTDSDRSGYWLGRALLAQGATESATEALEAVASSTAGGYYAYRARALLDGVDPVSQATSGSLLLPGTDEGRAEAEAWLLAHHDSGWDTSQPPAALSADGRWAALEEYLELGLRQKVVDTALALSRDYRHDAPVQYWLSLWLRDRGLYRPSIQCAATIIYSTPDARQEVPAFIWGLMYPTHYADEVLPEASTRGLDPLLFFALMRQESLFDAAIGSSAGAQGLAQVMPATGEWIALQLGDAYYDPTDLLRPHIAIRYGLYYLRFQLDYLGGNVPAALAAYNAGPGNAQTWLSLSGADADFFYETVAFAETRRYLDTVLPNYQEYLRLYRG